MLKNILVVDDNEDNLYVISEVLQDAEHHIRTLKNADNLSEIIRSFKPVLIILDVVLGEVDGREICDELKASPETRHIKIILISAKYSSIQIENDGYSSCDQFIEKPFDIDDLSKTVKELTAAD